jgi:hypothetical protein
VKIALFTQREILLWCAVPYSNLSWFYILSSFENLYSSRSCSVYQRLFLAHCLIFKQKLSSCQMLFRCQCWLYKSWRTRIWNQNSFSQTYSTTVLLNYQNNGIYIYIYTYTFLSHRITGASALLNFYYGLNDITRLLFFVCVLFPSLFVLASQVSVWSFE